MAFACLTCCKSFKREFDLAEECPMTLKCPECGASAHNFGRHFKAPKKSNKKQWDKIRFLFAHGFRFQKIPVGSGHHDTVPYPETMEEAKEFVVMYKDYAIHSG
jgi:hypothetical protein